MRHNGGMTHSASWPVWRIALAVVGLYVAAAGFFFWTEPLVLIQQAEADRQTDATPHSPVEDTPHQAAASAAAPTSGGASDTDAEFSALVTKVFDGDTILVKLGNQDRVVRLHGIDSPEGGQEYSDEAKAACEAHCRDKVVRLEQRGADDRIGRLIAIVFADEHNINEALIREGAAWNYMRYSKNQAWAELERQARNQRVGLWANPDAMPPWKWRQRERELERQQDSPSPEQ